MTNKSLFDSCGNLVAQLESGTLYTPDGEQLGLYLPHFGIFVSLDGSYLGEVVQSNRLMRRRNSPHSLSRFGARSRARARMAMAGGVRHCPIPTPPQYEDVPAEMLKSKNGRVAA